MGDACGPKHPTRTPEPTVDLRSLGFWPLKGVTLPTYLARKDSPKQNNYPTSLWVLGFRVEALRSGVQGLVA